MWNPRKTVGGTMVTPQHRRAAPVQVENSAGGYVFECSPWDYLRRFLILGSEGGTYYAGEAQATEKSVDNVLKCLAEDGPRFVGEVVQVSHEGLAPKNDYAVYALAVAASAEDDKTRALALAALPKVCRIPTHLFHFCEYLKGNRGWGRGMRTAVQSWYNELSLEKLALYAVKYQQRDGWSHRDVLRKSHPWVGWKDKKRDAVYKYMVGKTDGVQDLVEDTVIHGFEVAKRVKSAKTMAELVRKYGLTREMVPTEMLAKATVWEALLERMPMGAMVRNLGNMSKVGLVKPLSEASKAVCKRLDDGDAVKRARLHPLAMLSAAKVYAQGKGLKGKGQWTPDPDVIDAVEAGFFHSFASVEPTGKKVMVSVDVSPSMDGSYGGSIAGSPLNPREAAACMALVYKTNDPYNVVVNAFAGQMEKVDIRPREALSSVMGKMRRAHWARTDCAQPMIYAKQQAIEVDAFVILTDNETWSGSVHPFQALQQYRQHYAKQDARLVVQAFTSTGFTIADPRDKGMLDVVGLDSGAPRLVNEFIKGVL